VFHPEQYELLDFGNGRRLERFGTVILDRPCPAAEGIRPGGHPAWKRATARFRRSGAERGHWVPADALPESWTVSHGGLTLALKPTPFGHVGVFPEQAGNWQWIQDRVRRAGRPLKVLNLFAYTGGATLAAAAAGAEVVHVDAARNIVAWARRNAERSGLTDATIRWIVEDAGRYVRRELRRGKRYDGFILDPPSYGHGPGGEVWKLQRHLPALLADCAQLAAGGLAFALLTCHTSGYGPAETEAILADALFGHCQSGAVAGRLSLVAADGRALPSGVMARWPG
jgi:23S rRNA (cytosine1962-C5)-methyltransferase